MFSAQIESFFKNLPEKLKSISYKNLLLNFFSRKFIFSQRFISVLMFFLTLTAIYFYFARFRLSEAAIESNFWFDSAYPYRLKVSFSSIPVLTIPDFQLRFEVNTQTPINEKKIKSDCSGIIVVDDFGRELPFWIENCNKTNSVFYAKLNPSGPNSALDVKGGSVQNLYVYYGNKLSKKQTYPPSSVFDFTIPNLKIAYNFENDTATTSYDLSGNGLNLSKVGSPTTQPGAFGNAIVFKGDNYATLPFNSEAEINVGFTFLTWARMDYTGPGSYNILGVDDGKEYLQLQFSHASSTNIILKYREYFSDLGSTTPGVTSNYFFTGIAVKSGTSGKYSFNSNVYPATAPNANYYLDAFSAVTYLKLGTGYFNSSVLDYFSGPMDEFRYFTRQLTDNEMLAYSRNTVIGTNYLSATNTCNLLNNYCTKSFVTPSFPGVDLLGKYNSLITYTVSTEETTQVPILYFKLNESVGSTLGSSNLSGASGYLGPISQISIDNEYKPLFYGENKCIQGNCLYFDGLNDFVEIRTEPGTTNFDKRFTQKDVSYSLWIKPFSSPNSNRRYLISLNTNAGSFVNSLYLDANNRIVKFSSNASNVYSLASTSTIPYYKWTHISVTYDYDTYTNKIYINGALDRSAASAGDVSIDVSDIALGTSFENNIPGSTSYYKGLMDEVKFYDQEISATQVEKDYNYGRYFLTQDPDHVAYVNLMAYYPFDEADRGTVFDYSDIEAINLYPNTTMNNATGLFNNAFSPAGSSVFLSLPNTNYINLPSTAAYTMWVYTGTHSSNAVVLKKDAGLQGGGFYLQYNKADSKFQGEICGVTLTSTSTSPAQMWNHVLIQSDSKRANLYVNAKLEDEENCINNYTGKLSNTNPIYVGGSGTANESLLGLIDEFKIIENYLQKRQVELLFNYFPTYSAYGNSPEAFYKLDESDGTTAAADSLNVSSKLQINNSANYNSWTEGIIGGSYDFSTQSAGVVNLMTGATANPLIQFNDSPFTFSTWIQFSAPHYGNAGTSNNLVFQYGQKLNGNSADWTVLDANTFNNTNLLFRPSSWSWASGGESGGLSFSSNYIITTNASNLPKWYYLTFQRTYDPTIFINGDKVAFEQELGPGTSEKGLVLGNDFNNQALSLQLFAKLDEVKLYRYARSRDQIIRDMRNASTAPAFNSNAFSQIPTNLRSPMTRSTYNTYPFPIVYFNFDDPYGYTDNVYYIYFGTSAGFINFAKSDRTSNSYMGAGATLLSNTSSLDFSSFTDFNFQDKDFAISFFINPSLATNSTMAYSSTSFVIEQKNSKLNLVSTNYSLTSTDNINTNSWNHIYIQRNKDTKVLEMYLNGVFQGSDYAATRTIDIQNISFISNAVQMYLDEVKVFQNILDQNLIKNLQNGGFVLNLGSNYYDPELSKGSKNLKFSFCVLGDTSNCSLPRYYLKFDEQIDDRDFFNDYISGSAVLGSPGGVTTARERGYSGNGLSGSTNPQFVFSTSWLSDNTIASTNFWFKVEKDTYTRQFLFSEASNSFGYDAFLDQLILTGTPNNISVYNKAHELADDKWRFIHINNNLGTLKFYLDGVYLASVTRTLPATGEYFSLANSSIDELKYFGYERTPNQIAFEYSKNKPFVYLKMDECSGNKFYNSNSDLYTPLQYLVVGSARIDSGGYHNTGFNLTNPSGGLLLGSCQSQASSNWYLGRTGRHGNSFYFDGNIYAKGNDYHVITLNRVNRGDEASVSFWINPTNASHTATIIGPDQDSYQGFKIEYSNGKINLRRNADGVSMTTLITSPSLTVNSWSHIAITVKKVTTNLELKMYVNGNLVTSSTETFLDIVNECSRASTSAEVICATNPAILGEGFYGYLDEFKIYNFALTREQIKVDMNRGAAIILK